MVAVPISSYGGTSTGYAGGMNEQAWANAAPLLGAEYGVRGAEDWKVVPVVEAVLTLRIKAGTGFGYGVFDTTTGDAFVEIPSAGWWMVVARRNWAGAGGATEFDVVAATAGGDVPARAHTPGALDEQPLALVFVPSGSSVAQTPVDLRVWQANGGAVALSDKVTQYLAMPGTNLRIGPYLWSLMVGANGVASWTRYDLRPQDIPPAPIVPPLVAAYGTNFGVEPPPNASSVFTMVPGAEVVITDAAGVFQVTFPRAFPNGLQALAPGLCTGIGVAEPGDARVTLYDKTSGNADRRPDRASFWGRVWQPSGAPYAGAFRITYIAIGY